MMDMNGMQTHIHAKVYAMKDTIGATTVLNGNACRIRVPIPQFAGRIPTETVSEKISMANTTAAARKDTTGAMTVLNGNACQMHALMSYAANIPQDTASDKIQKTITAAVSKDTTGVLQQKHAGNPICARMLSAVNTPQVHALRQAQIPIPALARRDTNGTQTQTNAKAHALKDTIGVMTVHNGNVCPTRATLLSAANIQTVSATEQV